MNNIANSNNGWRFYRAMPQYVVRLSVCLSVTLSMFFTG